VDHATRVFAPDIIRRASRQLLVSQRMPRFAIQSVGIALDDLDVTLVPALSSEPRQVSFSSTLEKSGTILVNAAQTGQEVLGQGNRCLDSHKINIPLDRRYLIRSDSGLGLRRQIRGIV
jgi:hypothetical protein